MFSIFEVEGAHLNFKRKSGILGSIDYLSFSPYESCFKNLFLREEGLKKTKIEFSKSYRTNEMKITLENPRFIFLNRAIEEVVKFQTLINKHIESYTHELYTEMNARVLPGRFPSLIINIIEQNLDQ